MTTRNLFEEIPEIRKYSEWGSVRGLRKDILPFKLYEKAKKLVWDPADIDFTEDAEQWAAMSLEQKISIFGLATGFMVGEEGVTLDILPLVLAVADEGRTEETMFLTTFCFEEAKHVDFFRRWFDAIEIDFDEMDAARMEYLRAQGIEPLTQDRRHFIFQRELPRVMRRLINERSVEAELDAAVTYNQFVEGCLALAGYRVWSQMFEDFGVMPGLRQGLAYVQRDERRHNAYGTYLCRRILSARPELFEFAESRMRYLRDMYYAALRVPGYSFGEEESVNGQGQSVPPMAASFMPFIDHVNDQLERRIELLSKARYLDPDSAETGSGVEEQEAELEKIAG